MPKLTLGQQLLTQYGIYVFMLQVIAERVEQGFSPDSLDLEDTLTQAMERFEAVLAKLEQHQSAYTIAFDAVQQLDIP